MQDTGIVRKIDELGRVVLPIEIRKRFSLSERDSLAIYIDEKTETIILRKTSPSCCGCGATEGLKSLNNIYICSDCIKKVEEQ